MVLARTSRAQRTLAGPVRGLVTSGRAAAASGLRGSGARPALARSVPHQGGGVSAVAGRVLKPQLPVTAPPQREHASAASAKLGAVRTDWT